MKRKILISVTLIAAAVLIAGLAYLYRRPCDYTASFTVNTSADVAYFNILKWKMWNRKQTGSEIKISARDPVTYVTSQVFLKDTTLLFQWEFERQGDSATRVRTCVSDPDRRLKNSLTAPFFNTPFRKSVRSNLLDIMRRMEIMLETFTYEFRGPAQFDRRECVFINVNSTVRGKAASMIATVTELNQFVKQNGLGLDGDPFVVIHDWEATSDSINFDFCFPVKNHETIPSHPLIRFGTVNEMNALKTEFHGNYSITDISWHNLSEEAKKQGHKDNGTIIEVYYNDPHGGGDELKWKADIYLGIEMDL